MLSEHLYSLIHNIPGEDGWWKAASEEEFVNHAEFLQKQGMTDIEIYKCLVKLYSAVADCYGE